MIKVGERFKAFWEDDDTSQWWSMLVKEVTSNTVVLHRVDDGYDEYYDREGFERDLVSGVVKIQRTGDLEDFIKSGQYDITKKQMLGKYASYIIRKRGEKEYLNISYFEDSATVELWYDSSEQIGKQFHVTQLDKLLEVLL